MCRQLKAKNWRTGAISPLAVASENNLLAVASKHQRAGSAYTAASLRVLRGGRILGEVALVLPQAPNAKAARRDLFVDRPACHRPSLGMAAWTIQTLIDSHMRVHQQLDLALLRNRLGPDAPAMADDLTPKLKCSRCGGKAIGLTYTPSQTYARHSGNPYVKATG